MSDILVINGHGTTSRFATSFLYGLDRLGHKIVCRGYPITGFDLIGDTDIEFRYGCIDNIENDVKGSKIVILITPYSKFSVSEQKHITNTLNTLRPNDFYLFDVADYSGREWGQEYYHNLKYKGYLKREALQKHKDIIPFPGMSMHSCWYNKLEKDINVSCLLGHRDWGRGNVIDTCKNIPGSVIGTTDNFNQYLDILNRSKISVSHPGQGYLCYRDFEILSTNTILAIKRTPLIHFDMFTDLENIIFYDTAVELITKCSMVLNDEDLYQNIIKSQNEVTQKYHTPTARARQFLNIIEGNNE